MDRATDEQIALVKELGEYSGRNVQEAVSTLLEEVSRLRGEYLDVWNAAYDAGYESRDPWTPIRSADDLPKKSGEYLWVRKDGKNSTHAWYVPGVSPTEIYLECLAYMEVPSYHQEGGEQDG